MHGHSQMIGQNRAIQRGAQVNMARWKVEDNPHMKSQETEPLTRLLSRNLILEGNEPARNKSQAPNGIGFGTAECQWLSGKLRLQGTTDGTLGAVGPSCAAFKLGLLPDFLSISVPLW